MVSSAAAGQRRHRPDGLDDVAAHVHAGIGELAAAVVHRRDDGGVGEQQRARVRHRATLPDAADVRGRVARPLAGTGERAASLPAAEPPTGPNAIMREAVAAFAQGSLLVSSLRSLSLPLLLCAVVLAGCATRPINAPITEVNRSSGYRFQTRQLSDNDKENLVILAFSGGGTRAAAFSYGVLEELRRTEVVNSKGVKVRLLDEVDVITGVSGGSFTALAYGLYGDELFDVYEERFLKRDVQGELLSRFLSPKNWSALWSEGWGRSEMAAEMYDQHLFRGATFRDLDRRDGPLIVATATDISTGSRLAFTQTDFDLICSDVDSVPLSRAAAASSAVPLVLSPVTLNNYGGTAAGSSPAGRRRCATTTRGRARRGARCSG